MSNPFFDKINPQVNRVHDLRSVYNEIINSRNPQDAFMRVASNNPNLQPVINSLRHGITPETLVRQICQQRGIDVNQFLSMINSSSVK